jgi:hypothetical protein
MRSTRRSVEALIAKFGGGQYDGWEAEVRPQRHSALPLEHSETVVPNRPAARRMSLMLAIPGRFRKPI